MQRAQWLERKGQVDQALELLKRAAATHPSVEIFALARAEAYLANDNPFWALKVLGEYMEQQPPACSARALSARIHLQQGNLEQAEQMLDVPGCDASSELRLRYALLRVELAELRGDAQRVRKLVRASSSERVRFTEDDRRLSALKLHYAPELRPALVFSLGLGTGWASRGLGSVPLDLAPAQTHSSSALLGVDLRTQLNLASWSGGRVLGRVELLATQYLEAPTRELSSREPSLRLGALLGSGLPSLYLGYAVDWVNLQGGSQLQHEGFAYSEAHRVEYRLDLGQGFGSHGSLGARRFWESARNRIETTHGLSKTIALSNTVSWDLGAAWYAYSANEHAYTQLGARLETGLEISLPRNFSLRETLLLNRAVHPYSESYFQATSNEERRDTQVFAAATLATPPVADVRFELRYALAHRNSSLSTWNFTDQRAMLTLVWSSDSDRIRVRRIAAEGRIRMPYPDDTSEEGGKTNQSTLELIERIRSDDAQRSNGSCAR